MSKYETLQLAEKEGGTEMQFQDLPEFAVFLPFKKGARGSLRIKINPTENQVKKAGFIPDSRFGYSLDLENTLANSVGESLPDFLKRYSKYPRFIREIRPDELNRICTYFGQLFELFPKL